MTYGFVSYKNKSVTSREVHSETAFYSYLAVLRALPQRRAETPTSYFHVGQGTSQPSPPPEVGVRMAFTCPETHLGSPRLRIQRPETGGGAGPRRLGPPAQSFMTIIIYKSKSATASTASFTIHLPGNCTVITHCLFAFLLYEVKLLSLLP